MKILSIPSSDSASFKSAHTAMGKPPPAPVDDELKPVLNAFMQEVRGEIRELKEQIAKLSMPILAAVSPDELKVFKTQMETRQSEALRQFHDDQEKGRGVMAEVEQLKKTVAELQIAATPAQSLLHSSQSPGPSLSPNETQAIKELQSSQASAMKEIQDHHADFAALKDDLSKLKTTISAIELMKLEKPSPAAEENTGVTQLLSALSGRVDHFAQELIELKKLADQPGKKGVQDPSQSAVPQKVETHSPKIKPTPAAADHSTQEINDDLGKVFSKPPATERKVAFTTKLWDYLNEAASEVPSRKKQD